MYVTYHMVAALVDVYCLVEECPLVDEFPLVEEIRLEECLIEISPPNVDIRLDER